MIRSEWTTSSSSSGGSADTVLDRLFAAPDGMGDRAARNREEAKLAVLAIFAGQGAAGDTRGAAPGSKWCAANAVAEYADFQRGVTSRTNQMQRSFEDTKLKTAGASNLSLPLSGVEAIGGGSEPLRVGSGRIQQAAFRRR